MAVLFFGDRIKQATATTGTGSITLGSAETGYQTFSAAGMADTNETRYLIEDGDEWEIGKGTLSSSGTVLSRTLTSSSTGSLLNLSGSAVVMCTPSSEDIVLWQARWKNIGSGVAIGSQAGNSHTGANSVFLGASAGYNATSGSNNTFVGASAGFNLINHSHSTYVGSQTQMSGAYDYQVVVGSQSKTGTSSVTVGYDAGDQYGGVNTYVGNRAGKQSGTGSRYYTTAIGGYTGGAAGGYWVALGGQAMRYSGQEHNSIAIGYQAMLGNSTSGYSYDNIAIGYRALRYVQTTYGNLAIGGASGEISSNFTGYNNNCIGYYSKPSSTTASNEFTLGSVNISNLRCNDTSISSLSDERDKTDIQDLNYGLDFINDVRPVKFTWNRRDGSIGARRDIGFIAQELYDVEIDHSSTSHTRIANWLSPERIEARPHSMFPILVKAVQELSQKCDALEARIAELEGA